MVSISEDKNIERRVAITPEIAKKYLSFGFEITISENYGDHLGFKDDEYKNLGVKISNNNNEILESGDIIVQLNLLFFQSNFQLIYYLELSHFHKSFFIYSINDIFYNVIFNLI